MIQYPKNLLTIPCNIIGSAVAIAAIVMISLAIHALTPSTSQEAESGALSSCVSRLSDRSASSDSVVQFGTCQASGFTHPGVLLSRSQLDFVKNKIATGAEPWSSELSKAQSSRFGSNSYTPHPVASVSCEGANAPDSDCNHEQYDASAAYTQALLWYYTGDIKYAEASIRIINAWSSTLQEQAGSNTFLQTSWVSIPMTAAAEILRYTDSGWTQADTQQYSDMLDNVWIPLVDTIWPGGGANVLSTRIEAFMDMAVFNNDRDQFNTAVAQWKSEVPSIIYMSTDTNDNFPKLKGLGYPIPPPGVSWATPSVSPNTMDVYWHHPGQYETGLEGETCRDMSHATFGLDAVVGGAETAYIQGVNLYTDYGNRIAQGYEFNTRYFAQQLSDGSVPSWLCGGTIGTGGIGYNLGYEIAYSALHNRLGKPIPYTKAFIDGYTRPSGDKAALFMNWEELTSAGS